MPGILSLSQPLFTPPKTPRNVFFPWQTMCVHKSGSFLERNRLALRVPINFTKFEIREYLRKLYGARLIKVNTLIKQPERRRCFTDRRLNYYRNGPIMKKALLTLEHSVPDEVKMQASCRQIARNPAILKHNVSYGYKRFTRTRPTRSQMYALGHCRDSWRLPIPNLLAEGTDDIWHLNPSSTNPHGTSTTASSSSAFIDENERLRLPNPYLPHTHVGISENTLPTYNKPVAVPDQQHTLARVDLQPWRKMIERLRAAGVLTNPWANPALLHHPGNRGSLHPTVLWKPRPVGELWRNTHEAREKQRVQQKEGETPWVPPS